MTSPLGLGSNPIPGALLLANIFSSQKLLLWPEEAAATANCRYNAGNGER